MFYYFAECGNKSITVKREATEEEATKVHTLIKPISGMLVNKERINGFNRAYEQLLDSVNTDENSRDIGEIIQQKFSQLLFEFRKFCDNWETHLNHEYGKESDALKSFKEATAEEYDTHMEYRIMYQLRNYDQHCGQIFSKITRSVLPDGNIQTIPYASRDRLLTDFSRWKAEEKDFLNKQDEYIEFMPYADILHSGVNRIHEKTMQLHFNEEFFNSCAKIICIANEFENEDDVTLITTENEFPKELEEKKQINITSLLVPICKQLLLNVIKNNRGLVKILYTGEKYHEILSDVGYRIKDEMLTTMAQRQFVNFLGQNMIRTNAQINLGTVDSFFILADSHLGHAAIKAISESYKLYMQALLKTQT